MVKHAIKYGQSDVKQGKYTIMRLNLKYYLLKQEGRMIRIGVIEDDSNMRKIVSQIIEKRYRDMKRLNKNI